MTNNRIDIMHSTAIDMLKSYHLLEGIDIISDMAKQTNAMKEYDKIERIRETYQYMTKYMAEGSIDPGREKLHKDIIENLHTLADSILRLSRSVSDSDYYSSELRLINLRKESFTALLTQYSALNAEFELAQLAEAKDIALVKRKDEILERLFSIIYTSIGEKDYYSAIYEAVLNDSLDSDFNMQMVSALTLGSLTYYDRHKFLTLLDIYESAEDKPSLRARTLTGIVLISAKYKDRLSDDDQLIERLSLWEDNLDTYRNLRETIRVIISTRDTDRITAKMQEDVLPELMKLRPDMMKKLGEIQTESDLFSIENNPEWEEMLDKTGISEKMKELSELQGEGGDLMMVTFSNLKRFPFFKNANSWFLPFSTSNSHIISMNEEITNLLKDLEKISDGVCHSDMYSLALALGTMPKEHRDMMGSQFTAQMSQLSEDMKDRKLKSSIPEFDTEVLKYVRDMYRFFKLFRNASDFENPFENPLDFMEIPVLGDMMNETEVLNIIAEFYFKRGYYKEALPIFLKLTEEDAENATIHEKIGFCYQNLKDFSKALTSYTKAELLTTPGNWLIRKIAYVNKKLGNFSEACRYYDLALENEPENLTLIMSAGHAELENNNIIGALAHYYHALYLDPENTKIMRALGWLEILNNNFNKSIKAYQKISPLEMGNTDYLNLGHATLLSGNIKEATSLYKKSMSDNFIEFKLAFEKDIHILTERGISERDAHILLDYISEDR